MTPNQAMRHAAHKASCHCGAVGKRLFGEGTLPGSFRLVDAQQTDTGAVLHVYERAGDLKYGEVEVGQETVIFEPQR